MDEYQTEEGSASIPEKAIKEHETILREYRERTFDRMLEMFRQKESTKMNNISTYVEISGLMTAFVAANPSNQLDAAAAAVCAMGLAGEIGYSHMKDGDGNSTYRNRIIDAIYNMDGDSLEKGAKYEVR